MVESEICRHSHMSSVRPSRFGQLPRFPGFHESLQTRFALEERKCFPACGRLAGIGASGCGRICGHLKGISIRANGLQLEIISLKEAEW